MKIQNRLSPFETTLLTLLIGLNLLSFYLKGEIDWLGFITGISGVTALVLGAKGHIGTFYIGMFNSLLYAYVSFKAQFYGELMLNGLFYFPMQFIGLYKWRKHLHTDHQIIRPRRLSMKMRLGLLAGTAAATALYAFILYQLNGRAPALDATTTVIAVIAMLMSVNRFTEQYLLWMVVNLLSICLWAVAWQNNQEHSTLMLWMWMAYLATSVYGYINWMRMAREEERQSPASTEINKTT